MKYKLSSPQMQIFNMEKFIGGSVANITASGLLEGNGNENSIKYAIKQIFMINDALRIRIIEDDLPMQEVINVEDYEYEMECIVFNEKSEMHQWAKELAHQKIGLSNKLCRIIGTRIGDSEFGVVVHLHHIISDAWSVANIIKQFFMFYEEAELNVKADVKANPFISYLKSEEMYLESEKYKKDMEYWRKVYGDVTESTFIAGKHSKNYKSERLSIHIDREKSKRINELCRKHDISIFAAYASALSIYLCRANDTSACNIGTALLNRRNVVEKNTMGMFVNTVALHNELGHNTSFLEIAHVFKRKFFEIQRHQKYNYSDLLSNLRKKNPGLESLYDVYLSYQNVNLHNYQSEWYFCGIQNNSISISISDWNREDKLLFMYDYLIDLFSEEEIRNIHNHIINIIICGLENNGVTWEYVDALNKEEKHAVLNAFNDTNAEYADDKTIAELFEEQVKKVPDQNAVIFQGNAVTYSELNEMANKIARVIRGKGIGADDFVVIMAERSIEMIAGIYGILKAGGAYVPISMNYPEERIRYIIRDCKPKAILAYKADIPVGIDIPVIDLHNIKVEGVDGSNLEKISNAHHLVYAIYTSGTTGKPKGVMIENRSVVSFCTPNKHNVFQKTIVDSCNYVLATSQISFDIHLQEIELPLSNGLTVLLIPDELEFGFGDMEEALRKYDKIAMITTPTLMQARLKYKGVRENAGSLSVIMIGAEKFPKELYENLKEITSAVIFNGYGPTETTCGVLYAKLGNSEYIPIGKPVSNSQVYVLNGTNLCGFDMPGELCISGVGLARGYIGLPEQTNKSFVENPFGEGRLYRTGDKVCWHSDGNIEYIGRIDGQVKIRGFRIELGEIENSIIEQEDINDVVAIVREDRNNGKYIAAFIVSENTVDIAKLKENLGNILPDYMIPSCIIQLDKLPITSNGKIDKKALPQTEQVSVKEYIAPCNAGQIAVAEVFQEILGVERVGINDSFFELGGDSIKAIYVANKLRDRGIELNVKQIMQLKTVKMLANSVKYKSTDIIELEQKEIVGEIKLTPIQKEFFSWNLSNPNHFNQAVILKARKRLDVKTLKEAINAVTEHHDILRAKISEGRLIIPGVAEFGDFVLQEYDYCKQDNVLKQIENECDRIQSSMDLSKGKLIKAALFHTDGGDYLFICIHHLIIDGVSWKILLDDISFAYENIELPKKTFSFVKWADALYDYSKSSKIQKEQKYWIDVVKKANALLTTDDLDGKRGYGNYKLVIDELIDEQFNRANQSYHTSTNELLLSALAVTAHKWKNVSALPVLLEGHGREEINESIIVDRTIGWFTSIYPIVIEAEGELESVIVSTKDMVRRVPLHGLGYGILKNLQGLKGLESKPEISFNYLGDIDSSLGEGRLFINTDISCGCSISSKNKRITAVTIDCYIKNRHLVIDITYDKGKYSLSEISSISSMFREAVLDIIKHCLNMKTAIITSSDIYDGDMSKRDWLSICNQYEIGNVESISNLTHMQEGMLYHKIMNDSSSAYFVQNTLKITGSFDAETAKKSVELLALKHSILRSQIVYKVLDNSVRILLKERNIEVNEVDIREQNAGIDSIEKADIKRGFDLEYDSLLRVTIVKLNADEYYMIWSFHHIIMDGWCLSSLYSDFMNNYKMLQRGIGFEALSTGMKEEGKASVQYSEYVKWSNNQDEGKALKYWSDVLSDYNEVAHIRPLAQPSHFSEEQVAVVTAEMDCDFTKDLKNIGKNKGITINTYIETAWGILLQKFAGVSDVVFGKTISGRNADINGIEKMVGLFINTIPTRVRARKGMTVNELLKNVQEQAIESSQYDYCSLAAVQNVSELGKDLIKSLYVFENYYRDVDLVKGIPGVNFQISNVREQTDYELSLSAMCDETLALRLLYKPSMYSENEVKLMTDKLKLIIMELVYQDEKEVIDIHMIPDEEIGKILFDFNNTYSELDKNKTVVELFEEQVEKTPDTVAVVYEEKSITYGELNKKVNQIAHKLRNLGIKRNDYIAIMVQRSIEMIAGICGIIKAGAAYVPIDPDYPQERIQYILNDCKPKLLLVGNVGAEQDIGIPVIDLFDLDTCTGEGKNPEKLNTPDDLLYLIYTSGTTGKPKGVMIEHSGVVNLHHYFKNVINVKENDNILQFHNYVFDGAVWEQAMALTTGGTLYIVPKEVSTDSYALERYITSNNIQIAALPPQMYLQQSKYSIDTIITAGSESSKDVLMHAKRANKYINSYGPTECTVCATHWEYKYGDVIPESVPIGKPIVNKQVYILNGMKMCGIGMPGELCVAGAGLARGYLNLPQLTEEKFIKNPLGEGRLYRTGDLARWLPDGNIEYLGRIDDQVKIRGYRVELLEIDGIIRRQDGVIDVAVIAKEDVSKEKYIAAYIVSNDTSFDLNILRESIKKELPEYMVPACFKLIDRIPVTINGKLDRKALPEIELVSSKEYIAPQTEMEEVVAKIFSEVLNLESIGIEDNFFEIGGHSLRATRLMNRIEAETGIRLPLKEIFKNPIVKKLAKLIEQAKDAEYKPIPEADKRDFYPMSSTQKRLYVINEMEGSGTTYNMPAAITLKGKLDLDRVEKGFYRLIKRHEALRTTFHMENGELVQMIEEDTEAVVEYEEYDNIIPNMKEELFDRFVRPFDLKKAPLMRIKVVKTGKEEYILMIDMHHIISDGASMNLILEQFSTFYNGGEPAKLGVQYKDYSQWMRTRELGAQKEYWVNQFNDEIPVLDLPLDFPRPQLQSYRGRKINMVTSLKLKNRIGEFARKTGTTDYMVLLSAFMILLSKYSRQDDIIVGTPISGRIHRDTESMVGMFVNTLAMRGKPTGNKIYTEFLNEIKDSCLKAYEHQEYPFEELIEAIDVRRDMSRNPLFDVVLVMQNNEEIKIGMNGIQAAERVEREDRIAKFDITVNVDITNKGYELIFEYCTDLFKGKSIELMAEHYIALLEEIVESPEEKISEYEAMRKEEREHILVGFNNTRTDYPKNKTVIELFEEQVINAPDSIALEYEKQSITYKELNERANKFAYKLRDMGVGMDDCVVIMANRSIEMLVGIMGIVKAGGVYVPIDPTYPEDRINYMICDCKPKAILLENGEKLLNHSIPCLDIYDADIITGNKANPEIINTPNSLIYVIYTSGTTGKPKGSLIEHKSVVRLVKNTDYISLNKDTIVVQTGAMSFDASTLEVWGTLLNGGKLILASNETLTNPSALKEIIDTKKVNTLWLTSTLFNQMIDNDVTMFDSLKYLLVGGEKLSEKHIRRLKERKTNITLINGYGPTENTTFTATYRIPDTFDSIPIGKPISNTQVYVLNGLRPCGIGMPGELCAAGDGLARGYLNLPQLTKEKFIKNPFGEGRLYRTGDLTRWMPDGNIEYLGRIDEQVKIRGFRIELGEIESVIKRQNGVEDAAVVVRLDNNAEKYIAAYIVCKDEAFDINTLRNEIRKDLPEYMIPAHFMKIDRIPVTRNGKIDKSALPDIEVVSGKEYSAPDTETERIVVKVFEEVLNLEKVGIHDNFFEMGGHSLRATKVINRIEAETGVRLPLKEMFANSSAFAISRLIDEAKESIYEPLDKVEKKDSYPMSSVQRRLYVIHQMDENGVVYNMPVAITLHGKLDFEKVEYAFNELIKRHEVLRTSFHMENSEPVQKITEGLKINVEYEECTEFSDRERVNILSGFVRPFDLSKAPLMRVKVVKTSQDEHVLMLDMHHIISDGASMNIIVQEFNTLYNGGTLNNLRVQYKDYSEWMRTRDLSRQKTYWMNQFRDDIPVLDLPLDYQRPQLQSYRGRAIIKGSGRELMTGIDALVKETKATEYMILLSGLMILLSKYSRQEDIVIGSPISGRTHKDTENMLGMFVNTLPMSGKPEREKTYMEFLNEIKEICLKAYENQEFPFEELVECVDIKRDISRNPIFDVMFALQNNEDVNLDLNGVKVKGGVEGEDRVAKFDITVNTNRTDEGYSFLFEYCTDLFKQDSIEAMAGHYISLLNEIAVNPHKKICEYECLDQLERYRIIHDFNETVMEYPGSQTVVDLFEKQAERVPDNIAVVYEEDRLTYRELNKKVNQIAHKLRDLGVKRNDFVAIMAERSVEMIIGIYGVIKAGGAYVPIDTSCPVERVRYIINDCNPKLLLSGTKNKTKEIKIQTIDLFAEDTYTGENENPVKVNDSEDLIYLIYTSGTTGKPKGVMVEHSGVVNLNQYFKNTIKVKENDRVLQFHNYVFDGAVWENTMALTTGATLYVTPDYMSKDPYAVEEYIKNNGIQFAALPPQLYLQQSSYEIDTIITAGSESSKEILIKAEKARKYVNSYGPTECTICATHWEYKNGDAIPERIPIGKPITNKQVFILNGMNLCGIGIPGELCIAGTGLARGYLNQPELTKEKFVRNPFGEGRLYRTGDLARWMPDGNIEYLGRIDEQVKIRGFRVELLEIETVLRAKDNVADTAVIARVDNEGEKYIAAYIVAKEGSIDIKKLREELGKELPSYMVPAYFMEIESIPVTSNGKVNRKALPEVEITGTREIIGPRTETECVIVRVFEEILNVKKVGIRDNFFEMGGHSLRATKVINRIEAETGKRIALKEMFVNPTVEALASLIDGAVNSAYNPIPKAVKKDSYLMSSTQKRMYIINEINGLGTAYNMPAAIVINGKLDLEKTRTAFQKLVNRHESLRTSFHMQGEEAVQVISEGAEAIIEYEECIGASETAISQLISAFVRPFDFSRAPLMRIKVVKTGEEEALMIFDMHHIISDGASMNIIISEFSKLYNGDKLEPLSVQYKDYSEWIRTRDLNKQKDYWIKEFEGTIPVLDLPLDYQRPQVQSFEGAIESIHFDKALKEKIEAYAREQNVTEYMVLLSAVMILLSKYSRQTDIVVGSPISGRMHKDTENMLGMFVNTLAMRGNPEPDKLYKQFLEELRATCLRAYENQEYPFEELVDNVVVSRDLSRNPIFDVLFVLQNNESTKLDIGGLEYREFVSKESEISKFDISITAAGNELGYEVVFEYCTRLFKAKSIKYMAKHLKALLYGIIGHKNALIKDLSLISEEENQLVLEVFNDTEVPYEKEETIIDLFEEQARLTPDKIAAVAQDGVISFKELNNRANAIANKIKARGIKDNDIVSIVLPRKAGILSAMLGVLKAGAGYLPIDPSYPDDRIQFMIEDSGSRYIIAETFMNGVADDKIIKLDDWSNLNTVNSANINCSKADNTCYIIYTSGSTGKPKGTVLTHKNTMNFCKNNIRIVESIKEAVEPKMASTTTVSFDIFVTESLLCLTNGIQVVMANEDEQNEQGRLAKLIKEKQCTAMQTTPSKMKAFMYDKNNCGYLGILGTIILGGEAFPDELYQEMRKFTGANIFNIYGPSETTVWITTKEIKEEKVTIGCPYANTKIYILDEMVPCGVGIPGELCITGDSVGMGYLNRPELTKEKFIDNPFGEGKMYCTGDIARWLPDGNIEYFGRADDQVKIHGLRIELKEIESCIRAMEEIKDVVVIAREENGDKHLCAYMVSDIGIDISNVRDTLRKTLPEYMVPACMMQIECIPVTKNGKLDRRALPKIEMVSRNEFIAPRNGVEETIVRIFEEVLGKKNIGIKDSFFELGGHSLSATRLVNRIEVVTGVRIPLKSVFTDATPELMGKLVEAAKKDGYTAIPKAVKKDKYPMSSAQRRLYIINEINGAGTAYNMPVAMEFKGNVDVERIKDVFLQLTKRHEVLRTSFHNEDGELVQKISERIDVNVEYEKCDSVAENTKEKLLDSFVRPFDLSQAPLMRVRVVKTGPDRYVVLFDMHHIISDGASLNIVINEFSALYNGRELKELNVQYKDYSEWVRTRDLSGQKEYWVSQFSDEIPVIDLPYDYVRPQNQSYKGSAISKQTREELKGKIDALIKETGTTEYMVLLSGLMVLLGRYSRQEDIVLGSPISGRTHREMENMLGMFVNTLPMRGKPEGNKTYMEFLDEIKACCLKAYESQEYPFEELVEEVQVKRDLSRNPLFDVMFVLQNNEEAEIDMNGVEASEGVAGEYTVSKFDITVNVRRSNQGYDLIFEYCTDLFKKESIQVMMEHYIALLEELVESPNKKISEYSGIDKTEREQIIYKFNDTKTDNAKGKTVLELFEEQVEKTPDSIAVEYEDEKITYRELNEKVNQLAYRLRGLGVKQDEFVAIMAERSIQMIIGIYAIVKAGGAYVPIDPYYPADRIQYMLEDCKPRAILLAKAKPPMDLDIPLVDLFDEDIYAGDTSNPEIINTPKDLIYLIYTSGTTGKPKGVMNTREGCTNYVLWRQEERALGQKDKIIQKTTYTFDVSVWEIFWWSVTGASVVMLKQGDEKDAQAICGAIYEKGVTVMHFVPSMLNVFVSYIEVNMEETRRITSLKSVYVSGEALKADTVKTFHKVAKNINLVNLYGPTEASIDVTCFVCDKDYDKILIGKPIANTQMHVMNGMNLCGIGIPGELCIAGTGLARGYLNRPELTREKFIKNPFGEGRLYRTGDLARWLPDGNIEYLGRIDEQVKIRGFRIELAEIESVIRKQESVLDAAVIAREDKNSEKYIAAFVVGKEAAVDFNKIREGIRKELPDYMVPAYFKEIEKIPVTKNGKLDKRALPKIELVSTREYVAPRNKKEEVLAEVFKEILDMDKVGILENFFELGGDSIKAIRIVSKLREYGYKLDVKSIMQERTVEGMAAYLSEISDDEIYEQGEITGEVPLTPIQQQFYEWNLVKPEHFNQAIMLKSNERFDLNILDKTLFAVVSHHDMLRAVYIDGKQIIRSSGESKIYELKIFDLHGINGKELSGRVETECNTIQSSISLTDGPLLQLGLFRTDDADHLMICIHHMAIDGISWRVLLEDLLGGYKQFKSIGQIELPKKTASYKMWASMLYEYAGKSRLKEELRYWQDVKKLSEDCIGTKVQNDKSYIYESLQFSKEDTNDLLYCANSAYNTEIIELLLAGLSLAMNKTNGKQKLTVIMEGHGREELHKELFVDRTVGWFTSMYPVIIEAEDDLAENIIQTKERIRKIPDHGIGYAILKYLGKYDIGVEGEITFNYLGDFGTMMNPDSGIEASELSCGESIAKENRYGTDLIMNGSISGEILSFTITFNENLYSKETVKKFAKNYIDAMHGIIEHCKGKDEAAITASDLGAGDMSEDELSALLDIL